VDVKVSELHRAIIPPIEMSANIAKELFDGVVIISSSLIMLFSCLGSLFGF